MVIPTPLPRYEAKHTYIGDLRYHDTPGGVYPGVTTIMGATKSAYDKRKLAKWRKEEGEESAEKIRSDAAYRGTLMHEGIERRLNNEPPALDEICRPFYESLENHLDNISQVHLIEGALWHPSGFGGSVDLIAGFQGELTLWDGEIIEIDDPAIVIDWKTARKPKEKIEYIKDYCLQVAAYAGAFNRMYMQEYEIKVKTGLIFVALADRPAQVFYLDEKELFAHWKGFNERLRMFYEIYPQGNSLTSSA